MPLCGELLTRVERRVPTNVKDSSATAKFKQFVDPDQDMTSVRLVGNHRFISAFVSHRLMTWKPAPLRTTPETRRTFIARTGLGELRQ
jgi:hypothetical protein